MKPTNAGYGPKMLIGIIAALALIAALIVYSNSKRDAFLNNGAAHPTIVSINQASGPIGTEIRLKGYNLTIASSSPAIIIQNAKGEKLSFGSATSSESIDAAKRYETVKFTFADKACKQWAASTTTLCDSKDIVTISPGMYHIHFEYKGSDNATSTSNRAQFEVTK